MNGWDCEVCGSDDWSVIKMWLFGENEKNDEKKLCWDCRWPVIQKRLHGFDEVEDRDTPLLEFPEDEPDENDADATDQTDPMAW